MHSNQKHVTFRLSKLELTEGKLHLMPKVAPGKLTPKQAKFVQGIAEGKPAYKSAVEAYDTDDLNVANAIAVENLQKPTIRAAVEAALAEHHLTAFDAVKPVADALKYQGDTQKESLEMNLKGVDRYIKLIAMTEEKGANTGGNTFIFNNKVAKQSFTSQ